MKDKEPADSIEMESVFYDDEIDEQGEIIFKTDIADKPDKPWWHLLPAMFSLGAIIGFFLYGISSIDNSIGCILWHGLVVAALFLVVFFPFLTSMNPN